MNVLHTETLYNWGGQQNKIINEMIFMRELGHNVMLFCNPNSEISKRAKSLGFNVFECEMNKKNYHKTIPTLCKFIDQNNINLVISNGSTDSWVAAISGLFKRKNGVKFIREKHNEFPIKGILSRFMHRSLFDKIISVSPNTTKLLTSIGVDKNKISYIPTVVNYQVLNDVKSTFKQEFKIEDDVVTVGMFSAITEHKGAFNLAKSLKLAMSQNDKIVGIFAGNVSKTTKEKIIEILGKELETRVIFTGFRSDIANVIKGIDIFVFASHTEGLPTAMLEAMALSRPMIAFDKEPMNLLLENKRGVCVPFLDDNELYKAINLYINDKNLANQYGKNSSEFIKQNYDYTSLKQNLKILLESL